MFLTSTDPAAAARFYREVAGLPLEEVGEGGYTYWRLDRDGMQLAIHDAQAFAGYAYPPEPGFQPHPPVLHDRGPQRFRHPPGRSGIEPSATDDVVVTVVDPDGRR
ncbi:MAG: hypothetical protein QM804_19400 [Propionicimonas sp.]